jgi:hypothetical protein
MQFFSSSQCLQLCMAEDNVTFGFGEEDDQDLLSLGIFNTEQKK